MNGKRKNSRITVEKMPLWQWAQLQQAAPFIAVQV